ncbi:hypothetical protein [Rhodococcus sp. IEGM 1330]|uniref:hypothetical protein n=1 Tax=Rhodococcus sp. IEGM 1330 TaxID=3082225 RepID=UPI00295491E4|nr:hypothetical protein [Rhodococcus sp. IEGM 1330]MDV8023801.1 hypothetical protein [Rhodococcus sp. IEGM 1330]
MNQTATLSGAERNDLILKAVQWARLKLSDPAIGACADDDFFDLDWWEFRHANDILRKFGVGRPTKRINSERLARGNSYMHIALWEVVKEQQETATNEVQNRRIITFADNVLRETQRLPEEGNNLNIPASVDAILLTGSAFKIAKSLIESMESQMSIGKVDLPCAELLSWLTPQILSDASPELLHRGASVLCRAAADNGTFELASLQWFFYALRFPNRNNYLASSSLDLSVAYSSRRRYPEAAWVLSLMDRANLPSDSSALLAIGDSAWRRRQIAEALTSGAGYDHQAIRGLIGKSLEAAKFASAAIRSGGSAPISAVIRADIRGAEALSMAAVFGITSRTCAARTLSPYQSAVQREADRLQSSVSSAVETAEESITAYDLARLEVIKDSVEGVTKKQPLTSFGVLDRLNAIKSQAATEG